MQNFHFTSLWSPEGDAQSAPSFTTKDTKQLRVLHHPSQLFCWCLKGKHVISLLFCLWLRLSLKIHHWTDEQGGPVDRLPSLAQCGKNEFRTCGVQLGTFLLENTRIQSQIHQTWVAVWYINTQKRCDHKLHFPKHLTDEELTRMLMDHESVFSCDPQRRICTLTEAQHFIRVTLQPSVDEHTSESPNYPKSICTFTA